ncbi:MAG: hypothetical protein KGL39_38620 [Patescibacteria group bacterium]|nr:hypothetical protein [Patescibacteria group bacterium]
MTGAALGTGALALAGGGSLAMGLGAIAAVAMPAVKRLGEAWQAAEQYRQAITEAQMPGEQRTQNLRAVVEAEDQLQQAQVQSRLAQIALTEARREARNELVNLRLATAGAALGEKQASLSLTSARRSLYATETSPTATPIEVEQAKLQVAQSELGIGESRQRAREAAQKLAVGEYQRAHGGAVAVRSAEEAALQSRLGVRNAGWSVQQAAFTASGGSAAEQARLQEAYALSFLPPGASSLISSGRGMLESWRHQPATSTLMGMATGAMNTITGLAPTLQQGASISANGLAQAGQAFGTWLSSPEDKRFLITGSQMFAENITTGERVLTNVLTTLQHIMEAFRPFLKEIGNAFANWTAGWAHGTRNISEVRAHLGHMVEDMKRWTEMWMQFWSLLHSIMVAGNANQAGTSIVTSITADMKRWEQWVRDNPQKVQAFFRETVEGARTLWHIVEHVAKALLELARAFGPVLTGAGGFVKLMSETGVLGSPIGIASLLVGKRMIGRAWENRSASAGGAFLTTGSGAVASDGASLSQGAGYAVLGGASLLPGRQAVAGTPAVGAYSQSDLAGTFFVGGAERPTGIARLGGLASRAGGALESGASALAPFVLMQGGLELAGGRNPFASPVQGALMGGALPLMFGGGLKMAAGGAATGAGFSLLTQNLAAGHTGMSALGGALTGGGIGTMIMPGLGTLVGAGAGAGFAAIASLFGGGGPSHRERAEGKLGAAQEAFAAHGSNPLAFSAGELAQIHRQAVNLSHNSSLGKLTVEAVQLAAATSEASRAFDSARASSEASFHGMEGAAAISLGRVRHVVEGNIAYITRTMGTGSEEARDKIAVAYQNAATAVKQRMEETGNFTAKGLAFINEELRKALAAYGVSAPKSASAANMQSVLSLRQEQHDTSAGFTPGGGITDLKVETPAYKRGAEAAAKRHHARGGRLGGFGTSDSITTPYGRMAPGELIVNRHTEAEVNRDLIAAGRRPLGARVANQTVPHSYPLHYAYGGYVDPIGRGAIPERIDMGVDYAGSGVPLYALGAGTITNSGVGTGGWGPTWINLRLGSGPDAGRQVYYAEGIRSLVRSGQNVRAGQEIAVLNGGTEIGWAAGSGNSTLSLGASEGFTGANSTAAGLAMSNLIASLGGPAGIRQGPIAGHFAGASSSAPGSTAPRVKVPQIRGLGTLGAVANSTLAYLGGVVSASMGEGIPNVGGHGGSPSANERLARAMMIAHGWPASEWPYLQKLWTKESGFNAYAVNPTSGAAGIAQSLGHGPVALGKPRPQIAWGLNYIGERYGSPAAAWAHEVEDNWYARGGRIPLAGAFAGGGAFTTQPNRPVAFIAGDTGVPEDVHIQPRKAGPFTNATAGRTVHIVNHVHVHGSTDRQTIEEAVCAASKRSAEDLLAALERKDARHMIGIAQG